MGSRKERVVFECKNCGFTANAGINDAAIIKWSGMRMLRAGENTVKDTEKVMRLTKKETRGPELAEVIYGEMDVIRSAGSCDTHSSANHETRTTTVSTT